MSNFHCLRWVASASISSGLPKPRLWAIFDTSQGFISAPFQRLEAEGELQEQYRV